MAADVRDDNPRIWRRASHCGPKNCVEIDHRPDRAVVRDSKSEEVLPGLDAPSWAAFLTHCRTIDRH